VIANAVSSANPMTSSKKQARRSRSRGKKAAVSTKHGASAHIREPEEARVLLEKQLHSLYWWVFNAFRIRGFVRAKELDEMASAERPEQTHENRGLDQAASPYKT
jgi:hypothetical protein